MAEIMFKLDKTVAENNIPVVRGDVVIAKGQTTGSRYRYLVVSMQDKLYLFSLNELKVFQQPLGDVRLVETKDVRAALSVLCMDLEDLIQTDNIRITVERK